VFVVRSLAMSWLSFLALRKIDMTRVFEYLEAHGFEHVSASFLKTWQIIHHAIARTR
jgi:hypothetical protein